MKLHFRPEFLNRLDEIILFKPLTKENIGSIVDLLIAELNQRLLDKEVQITVTPEAKTFIINHGYHAVYGARPLKRYIQKNVETLVARMMLSDALELNQTIVVDVERGELVVR